MSLLGKIFSSGIGEVVESVGGVVGEFVTTDKEKRAAELEDYRAETARIEVEQKDRLAQIAVNQEEAKHSSLFVAGWRPFVGWVSAAGLAIHIIVLPISQMVLAMLDSAVELPDFDTELILWILGGLLGIGSGLRSIDKAKGVANHRVKPKKGLL